MLPDNHVSTAGLAILAGTASATQQRHEDQHQQESTCLAYTVTPVPVAATVAQKTLIELVMNKSLLKLRNA